MALIRLGSLVTRISGKVGGQTFGTSSSGSYIRNTGTPRKAITTLQKSKMSLMGTTAQSWRALTQSQRNVFNSASSEYPYLNRVGETKYYSGYAIYSQLRNNVLASLQDPPFLPVPLPKFTFTPISFVSSGDYPDDFYIEMGNGQPGVTYRFFMTLIGSEGISSSHKNLFYMTSEQASGAGGISFGIGPDYSAKWGKVPISGKYFYRIDAVHNTTGQIFKALYSGSETF